MGCDIHAGIEVKKGNTWEPLRFPNKYFGKWADEPEQTARLQMERNYSAFAILADVRNGVGFAGCDTGDGFVPIAKPRGLPEDAHPATLEEACTGDHSETFLMADELISYDWTRRTKRRGWVNAVTFEEWDLVKEWRARPKDWCGGISGQSVEHVSAQEMRRRVAEIMKDEKLGPHANRLKRLEDRYPHMYCQLEWEEPYTEAAGDLWTMVVPLVMKLKKEHEDVRLVMNFDS